MQRERRAWHLCRNLLLYVCNQQRIMHFMFVLAKEVFSVLPWDTWVINTAPMMKNRMRRKGSFFENEEKKVSFPHNRSLVSQLSAKSINLGRILTNAHEIRETKLSENCLLFSFSTLSNVRSFPLASNELESAAFSRSKEPAFVTALEGTKTDRH